MNCLTCVHRNPGSLDKHGFSGCVYHARWTFFPHQHTCSSHRNVAETRDLTINRTTMPPEPPETAQGDPI